MAANLELQKLVRDTIEPWIDSLSKPPFTRHEKIIMALVLHNKPLNVQEIVVWIFITFKHYAKLSIDTLWEVGHSGKSSFQGRSLGDYFWSYNDSLHHFEIPVTKIYCPDRGDLWQATLPDAGVYLRTKFADAPTGTFPFFSLPSELRTTVYEMVLRYPGSGMHRESFFKEGHGEVVRLSTVTREYSQPCSFEAWEDEDSWLETSPAADILGLLLVNKQMHKEASDIFYSVNNFFCEGAFQLLEMLQSLAPSRQKHLHEISLVYHPIDNTKAVKAFSILNSLPKLSKLRIYMDEDDWFRHKCKGHRISHLRVIPGLDTLQELKARIDVVFEGNCLNIANLVSSQEEICIPIENQRSLKRKVEAL